ECSATAEECVRGGISQKFTGNRSDQCAILNSQFLSDGNSELSIGQIHCPVLSWLRYRLQYVIQNRNALQRRRSAFGYRLDISVDVRERLRRLIAKRGHRIHGWFLNELDEVRLGP